MLWCLFTGFLIVGSCILTALEPSVVIKAMWIIAAILVLLVSFVIWKQPESKTKLSFKVSVLGGVAGGGRWLESTCWPVSEERSWPSGHAENTGMMCSTVRRADDLSSPAIVSVTSCSLRSLQKGMSYQSQAKPMSVVSCWDLTSRG